MKEASKQFLFLFQCSILQMFCHWEEFYLLWPIFGVQETLTFHIQLIVLLIKLFDLDSLQNNIVCLLRVRYKILLECHWLFLVKLLSSLMFFDVFFYCFCFFLLLVFFHFLFHFFSLIFFLILKCFWNKNNPKLLLRNLWKIKKIKNTEKKQKNILLLDEE